MKYLLPKVKKYFKTNLHTHSTVSDGKLSPKEAKEAYKAKGYQVLAITDHNIIADHSSLTDPDFLMLTGVEINFNSDQYRFRFDGPVYHLNLISKQPHNLWSPSQPPRKYPGGLPYEEKVNWQYMDTSYSPDAVNAMIAKANEMGFLVMYNHPTWSCQSYPDYAPLKGLWGVELRNGECHLIDENNKLVFKDLLNLGKRIFPVGTDDMHNPEFVGKAWIMLGAEELSYNSVINALEKGDFYMSCGPEISDLTVEGNKLRVNCSNAKMVKIESHGRYCLSVDANGENWLNSAEFDLTTFIEKANGDDSLFIYVTVVAPDGTYATTRAYHLNEL